MNIELNSDQIINAVALAVAKGLQTGAEDWSVQQAIADSVRESLQAHDLAGAFRRALDNALDREIAPLVEAVVALAIPGLREALATQVRAMTAAMIYGIWQGRPSYMSDGDAQRWAQAEALAAGKPPSSVTEPAASERPI